MSPFKQVVSSAIIDKYIGESARLIREMFNYAREHQVSFVLFCYLCMYT
jgi:ATP-dependent 26S proteasome regulatory subunit